MECFKSTTDICPQDLDPMLINAFIKRGYIARGHAEKAYSDATLPDSAHRVLASVQITAADYLRISTRSSKQHADIVFFPGCNVYFQPEKILNARISWMPSVMIMHFYPA